MLGKTIRSKPYNSHRDTSLSPSSWEPPNQVNCRWFKANLLLTGRIQFTFATIRHVSDPFIQLQMHSISSNCQSTEKSTTFKLMKKIVVEIVNKKALQILRDLEDVDLIKIHQSLPKTSLVSEIRGTISKKRAKDLDKQLKSLRRWRTNS